MYIPIGGGVPWSVRPPPSEPPSPGVGPQILGCIGLLHPEPDRVVVGRSSHKALGYRASVVLRSHPQLRAIVERAPQGFGANPVTYRYDVIFLKGPLTTGAALKQVPTREGVDEVYAGPGVLYSSMLISRASQSRLSRAVASMPIYQSMTFRKWNTTISLLRMMDEGARAPG
jgi:hypothetical protein